MEELTFKGYKDFELFARLYDVDSPIAVCQIIHGMQEHSGRYDDFCKFLNKNKIAVFISDTRGHGKSIKNNQAGYSKGDISKENIEDQLLISKYLKERYNNIPLTLIGHSYGSFLSQGYINSGRGLADKVILIGSAYTKTALMRMGKILANLASFFKGRKASAKAVEKIGFGGYGKPFEDNNWLTRDKKIWEQYKNDKYCGIPFPNAFYQSLFKMMLKNYNNLKKADKSLPIFIISGDKDPVGSNGKMVKELYDKYKNEGFNNIYIKLYEDCRHEILNELNKDEVYSDILTFIKLDERAQED